MSRASQDEQEVYLMYVGQQVDTVILMSVQALSCRIFGLLAPKLP